MKKSPVSKSPISNGVVQRFVRIANYIVQRIIKRTVKRIVRRIVSLFIKPSILKTSTLKLSTLKPSTLKLFTHAFLKSSTPFLMIALGTWVILLSPMSFAQRTTQERLDILTGRSPEANTGAGATAITDPTLMGTVPEGIPEPEVEPSVVVNLPPGEEIQSVTVQAEQVEPLPKPKIPTLRDQAFQQLLDKISPLTPEQIIEMRRQQDRTQRAVATPVDPPPRPVSSTLTVDLSPGATPPVVRLGFGFVTSIVFVDSTGQSWPISDYNLGNPKSFNIQWDKKTNTLFMQSTATYTNGNLAVRLATLDTPVMISLVSGQREVDYRVDVRVPGRGPNALAEIVGDGLPAAPNPLLLSVLDGVPPAGSQELEVCGGCGRAWLYKGKVIFRSQFTILSPAWTATVSSMDGTKVYELNPTPLIIASHNGQPVKIILKGY